MSDVVIRLATISVALLFVFNSRSALATIDPLAGTWVLNTAKSHYGNGAEPRRRETMRCTAVREMVKCEISSVRIDGRQVTGVFRAAYDGKVYTSSGIPEVDQVTLTKVNDWIVDATFLYRGHPIFGYRAVQSADRQSLIVISVDPATRRVLTSVIVYDRR